MSIKSQLTRLVLASILPAAAAAALLIAYAYQRQQFAVQENTLDTARALAQAVDRELAGGRTALQALATSPYLSSGNFSAFHEQARQTLPELPGNNIVLSDASGQQLVNTLRAFGDPLPQHGNPEHIRRVVETGQSLVSDLFPGQVSHRPLIAVDVPVRRNGQVVYVISLGFFPARLGGILQRQQLPPSWVGVIFDSQGTVVARTHFPERYVGQKAPPALVRSLSQRAEGQVETDTLEGIPVEMIFSRSSESNWTVAIGIPRTEFASQLLSSLLWVAGGTLVLLALGLALAHVIAGRIRRSVLGLIPPASALARGDPIAVPRLELLEARQVAGALAGASKVLRDREEILAVVTHDLRSPLNTMTMLAVAAKREAIKLDAERLRGLAAQMHDTAQGMSGLVDDLLAITVAHRGQSVLRKVGVNAADVLARAVQAARPQFEHAGLKLEVKSAPHLPDIHVDIDRILRVFSNLLGNALKFTERDGCVVISAEARPNCVRFGVANSGPPLPRDELDNMFQLFWQAQSDRRGIGLGLSISRTIVDTHGGQIWAETQQGMRVRICVELPSLRVRGASPEASASAGADPAAAPARLPMALRRDVTNPSHQ